MNPNRAVWNKLVGAVVCAAGLLAMSGLGGCVGYNTYPPMAGEKGFTNPNSDPLPTLMSESIRWVITRYPATEHDEWNAAPVGMPQEDAAGHQKFAVNLPKGVNAMVYRKVIENIGLGAVAMEPGNESLPTYSVSRLWVSGDEAKVDLIRPVPGLPPGPDGRPVTQGITVRLRGGMEVWHVTSHRVWSLNALAVPPLYYVPDSATAGAEK